MRYLLPCRQRGELIPRCHYLYDTFRLCFLETGTIGNFIVLESFPFRHRSDILIVYGHNIEITTLFAESCNNIHEKNVFIISCSAIKPCDFFLPKKRVYLAPQQGESLRLRKGVNYGFKFDITDVELYLYNSSITDHLAKLLSEFYRI